LLGIPIEILVQCNQFKSKHLNICTCNITQYYSILLSFEFLTLRYIHINTYKSRCSDKFNFQLVFKFSFVIYYIVLCGYPSIIRCVVNCDLLLTCPVLHM